MTEDESSFVEFYSPIDFSCENKLEKYSRKTQNVINELIHTEGVYVDRLTRIVNHLRLLQEENVTQKTVDPAQEEIYYKVLDLSNFHSNLLAEIHAARRDSALLAKVFIGCENRFTMYFTYDKLYKKIINHTNLMQKQKRSKSLESYNTADYLKEPNKRLPYYLTIFTELLKFRKKFEREVEKNKGETNVEIANNPQEDKDSTNVQAAIDVITNALRIIRIAKVIDTIIDCPIDINAQGHLLQHDKFEVTNPRNQTHSMMCSLFEHVLIFSVESQQGTGKILLFHDLIKISDLGLSPPRSENAVSFSVWYRTRNFKNHSLHADADTQKDWVNDITKLLVNTALKDREAQKGLRRGLSMRVTSEEKQTSERQSGKRSIFRFSWLP